jgi:3'(2'), 5'-bisphosphate nucleotidase
MPDANNRAQLNPVKDDTAICGLLEKLAVAAGQAIQRIAESALAVETKPDRSPVTAADREAETTILAGLREHFPGVPVVAEEEFAAGRTMAAPGEIFFLVDPLDGTREFVGGLPDYTVNVALVRSGEPVIGVVYAPAHGRLWSGIPGCARQASVDDRGDLRAYADMHVGTPRVPMRIVASRSHNTPRTEAFIASHAGGRVVPVGSSLKFCLIAAGEADLYPRFGRTMEWDTAAGDAVLRAAGGMTRTTDGRPLVYGKAPTYENPDFIAGT